jgi:hypothetical protein
MPTPGPSKSKNFAYTSIRLSSEATGMPVVPTGGDLIQSVQPASVPVPPVGNPFTTTTSVPVSGARPVPAPVSGARPGVPPSPQQSDELQAKLQQLQKQLEELEALKAELDASKAVGGGTAAGSRRKLLDSGLPGWDPGMLLEKVQLDSVEGTFFRKKKNSEALLFFYLPLTLVVVNPIPFILLIFYYNAETGHSFDGDSAFTS